MLVSRSHVRRTRRGAVVRAVREHYLRDDIPCGVPACAYSSCAAPIGSSSLAAHPSRSHYVIPDTNVFLHQIDVIEHAAFADIIVLQTVLDEIRHRSSPVYTRVRSLTTDPSRHVFVFSNEHHRDTYVEREPGESPNDRNDRAIRRAVEWYSSHIGPDRSVVLVSDDRANRLKAKDAGISAFSVRQYVETFASDFPELADMVSANTASTSGDGDDIDPDDPQSLNDKSIDTKFSYPEHLSSLQISAGLKSGAFFQGTLNISSHNFLEGSAMVRIHGEETIVQIVGREHLNRGVHGDVVAIQMLPKSEWRAAVSAVIEEEVVERDDLDETTGKAHDVDAALDAALGVQPSSAHPKINADAMGTSEDATQSPAAPELEETLKPTGRIVGTIKRNWRPFCGTIDASSVQATGSASSSTMQSVFFWAMDRRIPKIRIRTRQAPLLLGKRIVVTMDAWPQTSRYPQGHYVRTLGDVGDRATETEVLLLEHDVPFAPFSPLVLSFLPEEGENWIVRDDLHLAGREDLRHIDVCSIDPPGCTDIDDALHAYQLPNGNYSVGVHIADVSHFVKPGNAMDLEALRRGTTVYLVDKRIDMLPGLLGTNLCSLRSNVDRLSFSVIWEMTPSANVVGARFTKSVIRSRASLTYDEAQARLDDATKTDTVSQSIRALNILAKQLRSRRMEAGALTLASPEVRFNLENESQDPVDVELKQLKDTNALVEEFMLLANIYVAKRIYDTFPESSMLRRHPKPPATQFQNLIEAVTPMGIHIDPTTSKTLSMSLDAAEHPTDPYFNKLLRIMTTRCMLQAVYFCSGTQPSHEYWHYGLATEMYTHFTSPIRRYADLVVHRLLAAAIGYDKVYASTLTDKSHVQSMSDTLNYRGRMAQHASRSSVELYTHLFLKSKVVIEDGYVVRVMKNGCAVLVPRYGLEGVVYAAPVPGLPPVLIPHPTEHGGLVSAGAAGDMTDGDAGVVIRLFDRVKVQVSVEEAGVAAAQRSKLVMRLVEPSIPGMAPIDSTPKASALTSASATKTSSAVTQTPPPSAKNSKSKTSPLPAVGSNRSTKKTKRG